MIQSDLMMIAARVGQGIATAEETKVFLLQLQAKIAEARAFIETLPSLA